MTHTDRLSWQQLYERWNGYRWAVKRGLYDDWTFRGDPALTAALRFPEKVADVLEEIESHQEPVQR